MSVFFICKGSARDGLGHLMRTKSVAELLSKSIDTNVIVIGDEIAHKIFANSNLQYRIMKNDESAFKFFQKHRSPTVVFDVLSYDLNLFDDINANSFTVSLSPIFNCLEHTNLIFNRTRIYDTSWRGMQEGPIIRSGLEYATIGNKSQKITTDAYKRNLRSQPVSVAISMGGTDASNKTLRLVESLKGIGTKILMWIVLGEGYNHSYQDLVECSRDSNHEIILAKTNDSMWTILDRCVVAILAGGLTTYEAAYANLPSVNILAGKDKFFLIQELVEKEVCICAGTSFDQSVVSITKVLQDLLSNKKRLLEMHTNALDLIDSKGAERIASEILAYSKKQIHSS